jgi:DNA ligase-1
VTEAAARNPIRLYAFDLLYAAGENYLSRPQRQRYRRLSSLIRAGPTIALVPALVTDNPAELQRYFAGMVRQGLEGVVAKDPEAPYRAGGRGYEWVKLKKSYQTRLRDTVDLALVGYLKGRGKRAVLGVGSLLGAVYDPQHDRFRTVAKIGSGLSEAGWKGLRRQLDRLALAVRPKRLDSKLVADVWVEPTLVVEVLADEITRSPLHTCGQRGSHPGYALRFPRLVRGVRADRRAEDATTEQEIRELYRIQRRRGQRSGRGRRKTPPEGPSGRLSGGARRRPAASGRPGSV